MAPDPAVSCCHHDSLGQPWDGWFRGARPGASRKGNIEPVVVCAFWRHISPARRAAAATIQADENLGVRQHR